MLYALVTLLVLILDQAVKYWTTVSIELNDGVRTLIPHVLSLVNIHNTGAAFGILPNARWLFVLVAVVFVGLVVYALIKNVLKDPLGRWSAVLVMAGAVGNCIDRVMYGYVVDMFRFDFLNFAIFNVADVFITVCGILFCVYIIFLDGRKKKKPAEGPAPQSRPQGEAQPLPRTEKAVRAAKAGPAPRRSPAAPKASPADRENVRTVRPAVKKAPAASRPAAPVKAPAPEDPFAEWEAAAAASGTAKMAEVRSAAVAEEEPTAPAAKKSDDGDFSLEEILAEFSSK